MRDINQFAGDALIIGGGWCPSHRMGKPLVRNKENFYTADMDQTADPDVLIDFEDDEDYKKLPLHRFKFIYLEAFPQITEKQITLVLKHAHALLKADGLLIYHGGSMCKTPVPDLLKAAGFRFAEKKEVLNPRGNKDNGSISLAADIDLNEIKNQQAAYPDYINHYLNSYGFFSTKPYVSSAYRWSEMATTLFYIPQVAWSALKQKGVGEINKNFLGKSG